MANTFKLISSTVLSSSQGSVVFSSIPQTYTDLLLKISARSDNPTSTYDNVIFRLNGDTATNYSMTTLSAYYSGGVWQKVSTRASNQTSFGDQNRGGVTGPSATANTFGNIELYLPNYTSTTSKVLLLSDCAEDNSATSGSLNAGALLYRGTSAVTSLSVLLGNNYVSGSSFYLYGINNS